jgi:SAM-dependent methyltransferase
LEHIEDDKKALSEWKKYLKDGGKLILTVPAHIRLFGDLDRNAGHFRRYEKPQLISLLNDVGFEIENISCSGFPLINLMLFIYPKILWNKNEKKFEGTLEERTRMASYNREKEYNYRFLVKIFQGITILFSFIQRLFYKTDFGVGYAVVAKKVNK